LRKMRAELCPCTPPIGGFLKKAPLGTPKNFGWRKTAFFAKLGSVLTKAPAKTKFLQDTSFPLSFKESGGVKGQGPLRFPL